MVRYSLIRIHVLSDDVLVTTMGKTDIIAIINTMISQRLVNDYSEWSILPSTICIRTAHSKQYTKRDMCKKVFLFIVDYLLAEGWEPDATSMTDYEIRLKNAYEGEC